MPRSLIPSPSTAGQQWAPCPLSWSQRLGASCPQAHDYLAEEARRFEGERLRLYKYTPATEHIQHEGEGPQPDGGGAASEKGCVQCCCIVLGMKTVLSVVNREKEQDSPLTHHRHSRPRHRYYKSSSLHICHEPGLLRSARRASGSSKNRRVGDQTFKLPSS